MRLWLLALAVALRASPAVAPPDVALLNKAVLRLEQARSMESVARLAVQVTETDGGKVSEKERIHFRLQKPDKYQADVTLLPSSAQPGARYVVICDGARVWVSQAATGKYAVLSRAAFEQNDLSGLGLFGSLLRSSLGRGTDALLSLSALSKDGLTAQSGSVVVNGALCSVFALTDPQQGDRLRLALDPAAAAIRQLQLKGRQAGLTLTLTETVTQQFSPPALPASLFRFTPHPGAKQVKTLPIGLF